MTMLHRAALCALALCATSVAAAAEELPPPLRTTSNWGGLDVTLVTPGYKVFQGDPFDIGIELATDPSDSFYWFLTTLRIQNTASFDTATWSYRFFSDDTSFAAPSGSGAMKDLAYTVEGDFYRFDFYENLYGAWLDGFYNDKVVWSFNGLVIDGNVDVRLTLDETDIVGKQLSLSDATVIDPPRPGAGTPVPEPHALALACAGLGLLGIALRHRRARPEGA